MPASGAEPLPPRIALDTSAYSHLRRGDVRVIDAVARAELVHVPVTVLGELEAGFRRGARYQANRRALMAFLEEPFVEVVDSTQEVAFRYGEIFMKLREAGTPIPVNDIWIAAATIACGAHLVTFDSDFANVASLSHTILR